MFLLYQVSTIIDITIIVTGHHHHHQQQYDMDIAILDTMVLSL